MEIEIDHEGLNQTLDACSLGMLVHGIRALVDPDRYPSNEFTDRAKELVMAQYGVDGGYQIPGELLTVAFPPKINLYE